ncbi:Hypothetical predicted protein, partial [Paramuricea clavata]
QQLDIFNSLIKDCLDRYAPLRRSKITRPPAPWLNDSDVKQLQKERNELRYLAHKTNLSHVWNKFRETYIINGFIANHSFPDVWKTARVSPIPKVASPTEIDHYRPIAILPALSKVHECLIPNQIVKYIDQHNVLNENVTGFRKGHATSSVLLRVRDDILKAMKKGEITLIAFADFSKAFDTVDLAVIIKKLHAIGFSHFSFNWILNYLTGRKQLVQVNDSQSELADVLFGVPQGSILVYRSLP